ncbi:MAG: glycosyltransferase [Clostridiales bacterium]|nr:glycosyltransferase [Clostridiales bacterium]
MIGSNNPIKLSIITAVYNRVEMIEDAIISVLDQWNEEMEHIIIDGGSTDGTLDVLKKYPHLIIISEPDSGIYDAWNKGIKAAKGEYITFLNSDDLWFSNVVEQILDQLNGCKEIIITNAVVYEYSGNNSQTFYKRYDSLKGEQLLSSLINRPPAINAWIISKEVFNSVGEFDTHFTIAADVDFCIRAIVKDVQTIPIDIDFYKYFSHPKSITLNRTRSVKYNYQYQNYLVATKLLNEEFIDRTNKIFIKRWLNVTCYNLLVHSLVLKKPSNEILTILNIGTKNNILFPISFLVYSIKYWMKKVTNGKLFKPKEKSRNYDSSQ